MRSFICLLVCAACGGPANVAGTWTVDLTDRDNGCMLGNWTVGMTANGIMVDITQSAGDATANVNGAGGAILDLGVGGHTYTGPVDGDELDLQLLGTRAHNQGNCAYTYNSEIVATLNGNSLNGQIHYTAATNNNPDCATLQGCLSFQDFAGVRAPQ